MHQVGVRWSSGPRLVLRSKYSVECLVLNTHIRLPTLYRIVTSDWLFTPGSAEILTVGRVGAGLVAVNVEALQHIFNYSFVLFFKLTSSDPSCRRNQYPKLALLDSSLGRSFPLHALITSSTLAAIALRTVPGFTSRNRCTRGSVAHAQTRAVQYYTSVVPRARPDKVRPKMYFAERFSYPNRHVKPESTCESRGPTLTEQMLAGRHRDTTPDRGQVEPPPLA